MSYFYWAACSAFALLLAATLEVIANRKDE